MSGKRRFNLCGQYFSAIRKGWNLATCNSMDGPRGYYAKWSQTEKDNTPWFHLHAESKKLNKWINKIETDSQTQRKNGFSDDRRGWEVGQNRWRRSRGTHNYKSSHRDVMYTIDND